LSLGHRDSREAEGASCPLQASASAAALLKDTRDRPHVRSVAPPCCDRPQSRRGHTRTRQGTHRLLHGHAVRVADRVLSQEVQLHDIIAAIGLCVQLDVLHTEGAAAHRVSRLTLLLPVTCSQGQLDQGREWSGPWPVCVHTTNTHTHTHTHTSQGSLTKVPAPLLPLLPSPQGPQATPYLINKI
jgi:hypothetical protein